MPQQPNRPRRVNIHDVAKAAGVSRQTVTRAMNRMPGISEATKERVLATAAELHYRPSRFGAGLSRRDPQTAIGLLINDLRNPFYPEFAAGIVDETAKRGWSSVVVNVGDVGEDTVEAIRQLSWQVDAIVGYVGGVPDSFVTALHGTPMVGVDSRDSRVSASVNFDFAHAVELALDYLTSKGHCRIGMIDHDGSRRGARYRSYLAEHQLPANDDWLVIAQQSAADSALAAHRLVETAPDLDAIVVFNDVMALGVIKELIKLGIRVPDDIAVIGMDGISIGELVTPSLTTVAIDLREVGRIAVELIGGLLDGTLRPEDSQQHVPHSLVIRESA